MKKMVLMGAGVYLMPGWEHVSPRPTKEFLASIPGSFGGPTSERVAAFVISFSVTHGAWCGVSWDKLYAKMKADCANPTEVRAITRVMENLIRNGLLKVHKTYTGWYSKWLNHFEPRVICPTPFLISRIWGEAVTT